LPNINSILKKSPWEVSHQSRPTS